MKCFRRCLGMIRPGMALTYEQSRKIAVRKSIPLAMYLRARREVVDYKMPDWFRDTARRDKMALRKAHFRIKARAGVRNDRAKEKPRA